MKKFVIAAVLLVALAMVPGVMADVVNVNGTVSTFAQFTAPGNVEFGDLAFGANAPVYANDGNVKSNQPWSLGISVLNGGCMCCGSSVMTTPSQISLDNGNTWQSAALPLAYTFVGQLGDWDLPIGARQTVTYADTDGDYCLHVTYTFAPV
ncbi:hypothetical protein L0665_05690 [Methanogenium marinum]|uniref:Uncharacterized protein n=1 Tax=Methanogenium marinum TaxID=348610 RepID=A0A9Q4KT38_9EURY|nr:hypothetical protein [Methanogenium marinum]MDE4908099.1 hypothetical protein [Methanogenium marinum]